MRILFVHNNFPGQFVHLAPALMKLGHDVMALSYHENPLASGIKVVRYPIDRGTTPDIHYLAAEFEAKMIRAHAAAAAAHQLKQQGYHPDVIYAHPGWGEAQFLKDVWPGAVLLCYWEFFYQLYGADVNFDPEFPTEELSQVAKLRVKNAPNLLQLHSADAGISPTHWQRQQFPGWAQDRIEVIHDGIDTDSFVPNPQARVQLEGMDRVLVPGDEVITFISRELEPYRGYHVLMRALPALMQRRPNAHVVIVGGSGNGYGQAAPEGKSWKEIFLSEVAAGLDMSRLHFVGKIPHHALRALMQVSAAHVYLTYPFVLSWSILEAMSIGCLVIGSRTAPVEEVIDHGRNGILVDFFDIVALVDQLADVLANPHAYVQLRVQARQDMIERYDLQRVCLPDQIANIHRVLR